MQNLLIHPISVWLLITSALPMQVETSGAAEARPFEGKITATLTRRGETQTLLYSIGPEHLCVERAESDVPYATNLLDRRTAELTLLYPHNRSYLSLSAAGQACAPPGPVLAEPAQLHAGSETATLLGYPCTRYEVRRVGVVLDVWATELLAPFLPWRQNEAPRFGPREVEDSWGELLQKRGLFPLRVSSRNELGSEDLRFEVNSITPGPLGDPDGSLFRVPSDYHRLSALPF